MNLRQQRFCREYLIDFVAEKAMIRAGYTERHARGNAHRMMANDGVRAEIAALIEADEERLAERRAQVRAELERIAFDADVAISHRLAALALLAKQLGMLTDRVQVEAQITEVEQPSWSAW